MHIDVESMRDGAQFTMEHMKMLVKQVTNKEVEDALKDIGDNKAPDIDGFGSKFYKVCWHIIKDDVMETVREFFYS